MKQMATVFKFEFMQFVRKKSFIITTVVLMLAAAIVLTLPRLGSVFSSGGEGEPQTVALLDQTGQDPHNLAYFNGAFKESGYTFTLFDGNEAELTAAVDSGEVEAGVVLVSDASYRYIVRRQSMYDTFDYQFASALQSRYQQIQLQQAGLEPQQAADILAAQVSGEVISTQEESGGDPMSGFWYTYILVFGLYMAIVLFGQFVASSVANEKSSRAMEVLITSAKPRNLMFGKVFGTGCAGLAQFALILGTALIGYRLNESYYVGNPVIQSIFGMPVSLVLYALLFFVLGFFIFAFVYAALASTVSKMDDMAGAIQPATYLLMIAFFVVLFSISTGNVENPAILVCSFIPFTSPMAMFARIAMGSVPAWQIILSIGILVASVIGIGYLATAIYRVGVLMYGNRPKLKEVFKMLRQNKAGK